MDLRGPGEKLLPVMVFFYGGGFMIGSGSEHRLYEGSYIAQRKDVVVVTLNYRLGPLGFLSLDDEFNAETGVTGNYAIEDQRAALVWVQNNIRRYAGAFVVCGLFAVVSCSWLVVLVVIPVGLLFGDRALAPSPWRYVGS
jgi:para-nitrobenzyl esterase